MKNNLTMKNLTLIITYVLVSFSQLYAKPSPAEILDEKRTVFLGDSITQAGTYVSCTSYYLQRLYPDKTFDIYPLGLSSETVSGLSEKGHAGGRFPRPCLFERLGRLLEKLKPDVVFACYGINCGLYKPLDEKRFAAYQDGVKRLIKDCKAAGVQQIYLITPPIYDATPQKGKFNYDSVMAAYAKWEMTMADEGVKVIDLHSAMRAARNARSKVFSKDKVHPSKEGHLFMARTILNGLGIQVPEEEFAAISKDPLYKAADRIRVMRGKQWMNHIGYTRQKLVKPQPLGDTEIEVAKMQKEIDALRRKK
jgi:lysophospholipase L1-like esterase